MIARNVPKIEAPEMSTGRSSTSAPKYPIFRQFQPLISGNLAALSSRRVSDLPPMELGYARTELRRQLVDAVLRGEKTATASLQTDYEPHTTERLPQIGERFALLDFDDEPVGVVEATELRIVRAGDVDLAFARDEGEGYESVEQWRTAHERFWVGQEITDDTMIVALRFRLMEPIELVGSAGERVR